MIVVPPALLASAREKPGDFTFAFDEITQRLIQVLGD
jgi:hypothetical protein